MHNQSELSAQFIELLDQRPRAPILPTETLHDNNDDNQIITEQNHPSNLLGDSNFMYCPSFIGKTFGVRKQMEYNRTNTSDFFTSPYLDKHLQALYTCLDRTDVNGENENIYDSNQCILRWQENPSEGLKISVFLGEHNKSQLNLIPRYVHTLVISNWFTCSIPFITCEFAERDALVSLNIRTTSLPVMPHIKILNWMIVNNTNPDINSDTSMSNIYDFSGWTNLRILILKKINPNSRIRLPPHLLSLSISTNQSRYNNNNNTNLNCNYSFENMFGNSKDQLKIFQSLDHLKIEDINWSTLPSLFNCKYLTIGHCNNIQIIDVPKCRSVKVNYCKSFIGFSQFTLKQNNEMDTVIFIKLAENNFIQLPPGAPTGYRHIDILRAKISELPKVFASFAYISIIGAGYNLFIKDPKLRDTLEFYFDHNYLHYFDLQKSEYFNQCIPKLGESFKNMINRLYGFNWLKFITRLQRQIRFKQYMKNIYKQLVKHVTSKEICNYEIARYLGASNTFKNKKVNSC